MSLWAGLRAMLLSGFGLLLVGLAFQAQALTLELRDAQARIRLQGQATATTQTTPIAVGLPYHWD